MNANVILLVIMEILAIVRKVSFGDVSQLLERRVFAQRNTECSRFAREGIDFFLPISDRSTSDSMDASLFALA